jgi:hypothetical protein
MQKIKSYSLGYDTVNKVGYINLTTENNQEHSIGKIPTDEFAFILKLLSTGELFLDNQQWLVAKGVGVLKK